MPKRKQYRADLTPREWDVAEHIAKAFQLHEIADKLCISKNTVETHMSAITQKWGLVSKGYAGRVAIARIVLGYDPVPMEGG